MAIETTFGEERPTYFVIREGGEAPRHRHRSRFAAEKEAARLARKTPGATFHVLKLKKTVTNTASAAEKTGEAKGNYPDDGGLQDPVRAFEDVASPAAMVRDHFTRTPQCGDLVTYRERGVDRQGEISEVVEREAVDTGYAIRDIIDNIIMPRLYGRDEFEVTTKVENRPKGAAKACDQREAGADGIDGISRLLAGLTARAVMRRFGIDPDRFDPVPDRGRENYEGRRISLNSEVWVVADDASLFGGDVLRAFRAVLTKYDEDVRFVWCKIEGHDAPSKINASRVYALDDPRIMVVAL